MAKPDGTMTVPIFARISGKDIHLGDLVLEVKVVNGRIKAPSERDIKSALRHVRFR